MAVLKLQVVLFAATLISITTAQTWNSLGCYTVANSDREVLVQVSPEYQQMTPTLCQTACGDLGFTMAGVENGNECWCGNVFKTGSPSNGCTIPCNGDSNQVRLLNKRIPSLHFLYRLVTTRIPHLLQQTFTSHLLTFFPQMCGGNGRINLYEIEFPSAKDTVIFDSLAKVSETPILETQELKRREKRAAWNCKREGLEGEVIRC